MPSATLTAPDTESTLSDLTFERPVTVCFVCTGNTCRSPMAEAVLNHLFRVPPVCTACDMEKVLSSRQLRATSAGLYAMGDPIAANAVAALEDAEIPSTPDNDYKRHVSRPINPEIMETADLVVGLTESHAVQLMSWFPRYASKITCFPRSIPDPFGGDLDDYRDCLAAITEGIREMFPTEDKA